MLSPSRLACDFAVLPHRVLSLLLSFPRFVSFPLSILCMGRQSSSGCCVILRSPFIGATSNFFSTVLCRPMAPTNIIYISQSPYNPVSGSHLVSAFSYITTPSLCVRSLSSSLALAFIVCAYYFLPLTPFILCIFSIRLLSFSSVYIASLTVVLP